MAGVADKRNQRVKDSVSIISTVKDDTTNEQGKHYRLLFSNRKKINLGETKPVALSLIDPYTEQFVVKSRNVPVLSDLYDRNNLELDYPELLQKWVDVKIMLLEEVTKIVKQDTREQAKGPGFFSSRKNWIL